MHCLVTKGKTLPPLPSPSQPPQGPGLGPGAEVSGSHLRFLGEGK